MKKVRIFLRNAFIAGILSSLPLVVTYYIIRFVFDKLSGFLLPYFDLLTVRYDIVIPRYIMEFFSFMMVIFGILCIGIVAKNYMGKKFFVAIEIFVSKIPFAKTVYGIMRQIVDTFQNAGGGNFQKVVLVEYPRKGIYSLGFITKEASSFYTKAVGEECVSVFIPTTPNPTSGFILIIPKSEMTELDIPVEDGVKYIISAGILDPTERTKPEL